MGKKNSGGKNFKKQKKISDKTDRDLVFSEDGQAYAMIKNKFGDGRFNCELIGINKTIIGHIAGSMRKKVWINIGDIVLVSLREFNLDKCDIIHKYNQDEARSLKSYGEIPENYNLNASLLDIMDKENSLEENLNFDFEEI